MTVVTWILSALLALAFLAAGVTKLASSREKLLKDPKLAWVDDFSTGAVKAIGGVEVLGALGVVLPWLLGVARVLTPLAATGLALTMVGAAVVHARRGELRTAGPVNAALFVLAAAVTVLRFTQL